MSDRVNRRNYYRVLHVQHDAPDAVIKSSYRALMRSLEMHPDRGGEHWNAALINEAYRVLSDPQTRAAYDELLVERIVAKQRATEPEPAVTLGPSRHLGVTTERELCLFCGTETLIGPEPAAASCPTCGSPLTLAQLPRPQDSGRRATKRVMRSGALRYYERWPQFDPVGGRLVDLSVGGLRMVTTVPPPVAHIVKIEGPLLDAVGRVVSCAEDPEGWSVGIEFYTLRLREPRGTFLSQQA